ncbi:MAG TPA: TasA family protein [Dehalococcoidia bacterium]|nr:TasA family protein [Dehalococcoidia bacterium]
MNKSVLLLAAALLVVGAGGMVGAGTQAVFTDTAASSGNTFVAGTLNLKLNGSDSVTGTITGATMKPGDYKTGSVTVSNSGSLAGTYTMSTSVPTEVEGGAVAAPLLKAQLLLRISRQVTACDNPNSAGLNSLLNLTDDTGLYGTVGGAALNVGAVASQALAASPDPGEVLCFEVLFPNNSGNDYQGDSIDATFTFTLTQS